MAPRIVVTIEAESGSELIRNLRELLSATEAANSEGASALTPTPSATPTASVQTASEQPNAQGGSSVPAPEGASPTPARGRGRGKSKGGTAETPPPPPAETPAAPTANDVAGMFADIPSSTPAAVATTSVAVTRDQLRAMGNQFMETMGVDATVKILADFSVSKLSEVPEVKWPDIFKRFDDGLKAHQRTSVLA